MLGALLQKKRKALGVSMKFAASAIGITQGHLCDLEHGHQNNPTMKVIVSLMETYDIKFSEIHAAWKGAK